jgi:hypothetical protein
VIEVGGPGKSEFDPERKSRCCQLGSDDSGDIVWFAQITGLSRAILFPIDERFATVGRRVRMR